MLILPKKYPRHIALIGLASLTWRLNLRYLSCPVKARGRLAKSKLMTH